MKKRIFTLIFLSASFYVIRAQSSDVQKIITKYENLFEWKIQAKYEGLYDVSEENILVVSKGKYMAYMNLDEKMLTPFEWKFVSPAYRSGIAVVKNSLNGWQYIIDIYNNGKKINDERYQTIYDFSNGYAVAESHADKYGVIDSTGKFVIDHIYGDVVKPDNLKDIIEGRSNDFIPVKEKKGGALGAYGYVNFKGEWVKEPKYVYTLPKSGDFYPVLYTLFKNDKGMLDSELNDMIPFEYENLIVIDNEHIKARKKGEKWGVLNTRHEIVIPFEYDLIGPFNEMGKAYFEKGNSYGYVYLEGAKVELKGKLDREPILFFFGKTEEGRLASYSFDDHDIANTFGICSFKNDKIIIETPANFSSIHILGRSGKIIVAQKGKKRSYYGMYSLDLKLLIDPSLKEFDYIGVPNESGYFTIGIMGEYGVARFK
jgi:hypothetical protein